MSKSWNDQDRQSFKDRDILKARTVSPRRHTGPTADEWDWRNDNDLNTGDEAQ